MNLIAFLRWGLELVLLFMYHLERKRMGYEACFYEGMDLIPYFPI